MNWPKCSNLMVAGKTHIGGGGATFFMFGGASLGNLTFKAEGWSEHIMQNTSDVLPAHYCDLCGAVVVETRRRGLSTLEK